MEENKIKYTAEGFEKLQEELNYLKNVRRQEVKDQLKEVKLLVCESFAQLLDNKVMPHVVEVFPAINLQDISLMGSMRAIIPLQVYAEPVE